MKSINRLTFAYNANECKPKVNWAEEIRRLLEEYYPHAERIRLVCDNLNTHTYNIPSPDGGGLGWGRTWLTLCPHPNPPPLWGGDGLLSVLTRQCVKEIRFELLESLRAALESWARSRNGEQKGVHWQFATADARVKLTSLYPKILT